jgi:cation diffusion facilitator CzcD-associated flavoprotein CzcO
VSLERLVANFGDLSMTQRNAKIDAEGLDAFVVKHEKIRCKVLIPAVGALVEPKVWPENITGQENFKGPIFHSARWDHSVDFTDKNVVVVGTGCSAAQFVPKLTKAPYNAKSVTQLMREPPWVSPRIEPPGGIEGYEKWSPSVFSTLPGTGWIMRQLVAAGAEYDWRLFGDSESNKKARAAEEIRLLKHLKTSVPAKYHEILTPNYGVCCKRRIFDATWFPGLNDDNIELTTLPLTGVNEKSVTLGPGRCYPPMSDTTSRAPTHKVDIPADVIVLANGFQTTDWVLPLKLYGRGGRLLNDVWKDRGGPQAYLGTAMDGFRK